MSDHWYKNSDGITTACYEMPKKRGNGMKSVTLREAREFGLLPSVTTILSVVAKPELINWIVSNSIMAALTLPRVPDEPLEVFAKRVVEDADTQRDKAADFGIRIHDAIEAWLVRNEVPAEDLKPFVHPALLWLDANILDLNIQAETIVGCPIIGIAGRLDLVANLRNIGPAVVDFKTQRVRDTAAFYPEFPLQLCAYRQILGDKNLALVSVVIDSGKPSEPHIKVWENPDQYWPLFEAAFTLWRYLKNFDPRRPI